MKYVLMCSGSCADGFERWEGEYSGIEHSDREEARKEWQTLNRQVREANNVDHVWIKEVEE